jgi:hypothetical protein
MTIIIVSLLTNAASGEDDEMGGDTDTLTTHNGSLFGQGNARCSAATMRTPSVSGAHF